jgi:serine/threonine-protein kinase
MLSGQPPFSGDSPLAVAVQHLQQPAPPITVADLSEAGQRLSQIIERMMAKKPADRFRDPAVLLDELNTLLSEGASCGRVARADAGSLAEILQAADQRSVATSRLDELMKTTAMVRPNRTRIRWIVAAITGCALLGAIGAAVWRPPSLLASAQSGPEKSDDVWGQLYQAKLVDTEEGWLAVEKNFPQEDDYYHHLARQGLINYYLTRTQDYEQAIERSQELVATSKPDLKAFGYAGLVVANVRLGDYEQAVYANQLLTSDMRDLLNQQAPRMARLLSDALDELVDPAL